MLDLPQIRPLGFERGEHLFGRVRRAIVDVDQFEAPAAIERRCDLVGEEAHVVGLVAHGHDDRNGRRGCWRGLRHRHSFGAVRPGSYWPISRRATILTRDHDGPGIARTMPSRAGMNASLRAANQLRTRIAPKPPTNAAASTSLTKCAWMITRLAKISAA